MNRITRLFPLAVLLLFAVEAFSQNPPWRNPLMMAWSTDGVQFDTPAVFQDSSGVPCVIRWKGDTLIAAFQWFRQPVGAPSWDRVAVKFSFDNGLSWTTPTPIEIDNFPANYQRPFDPTLATFLGDSLRIYFSSSDGLPAGGLNASVNTYSAKSADGIHYTFEPQPRVDVADNRVIDPAVIYFNNSWHFAAPIGAPQQGAYHYVSPNGLQFSPVPNIPSDNTHNWTGNYMVESPSELRFYGSGPVIWFKASPNGGTWNGFVHTNLHGGDPSVVKIQPGKYLAVYVGPPYNIVGTEEPAGDAACSVFPNPATDRIQVRWESKVKETPFILSDLTGKTVLSGQLHAPMTTVDVTALAPGVYILQVGENREINIKLVKK